MQEECPEKSISNGSIQDTSNSKPFISVVIPAYNVEKWITNALKSLAYQTYVDFELIIVDDGCTDRTIEFAEKYLCDKSISYKVIYQTNAGQGKARNAGFSASNGEWVCFLDADDVIQPFLFEGLKRIASNNPNCEMVFSNYQTVNEDNVFQESQFTIKLTVLNREQMLHAFLLRSIVPLVPGSFYKRSFLARESILHSGIRWSEDQEFMWRVIDKLSFAAQWDCITYNYLRRAGSTMNSTTSDRIVKASKAFESLENSIDSNEVKQYLFSRWVYGCLHSTAKYYSFPEWLTLFNSLHGERCMSVLRSFPSSRIKHMARIARVNKHFFYIINRLA